MSVLQRLNRSPGEVARKAWHKLFTFRLISRKLSQDNLERMGRDNATDAPTLVIYSEFDHQPFYPNRVELPNRKTGTSHYYDDLAAIASESFDAILCSGLLEHMTDPKRLIDECRRILRPGGTLIMSASAVFAFHRGPDNYFHFTPHGIRLLMPEWTKLSIEGSSQPFETIGILMERVLLQCEVVPPVRPVIELLAHGISSLDRFVLRQYDTRSFAPERRIDSMMPSNLQVIAVK
jgi:SAM-dependent methyltransferase